MSVNLCHDEAFQVRDERNERKLRLLSVQVRGILIRTRRGMKSRWNTRPERA